MTPFFYQVGQLFTGPGSTVASVSNEMLPFSSAEMSVYLTVGSFEGLLNQSLGRRIQLFLPSNLESVK